MNMMPECSICRPRSGLDIHCERITIRSVAACVTAEFLEKEFCEVRARPCNTAISKSLPIHRRSSLKGITGGSDLIMITRPDPFSSTSIETLVSLKTVGGLYRGSLPFRRRP
jgi:hypothetical protein